MAIAITSFPNIIIVVSIALIGFTITNGLKCYMCGQYNEGVGSITPCLNYSDRYAHLYLKECTKPSEKYCVKYVSELSTVRDCATECAEKEIWETKTYCCTEEGCNGSTKTALSSSILLFFVTIVLSPLILIRH